MYWACSLYIYLYVYVTIPYSMLSLEGFNSYIFCTNRPTQSNDPLLQPTPTRNVHLHLPEMPV